MGLEEKEGCPALYQIIHHQIIFFCLRRASEVGSVVRWNWLVPGRESPYHMSLPNSVLWHDMLVGFK